MGFNLIFDVDLNTFSINYLIFHQHISEVRYYKVSQSLGIISLTMAGIVASKVRKARSQKEQEKENQQNQVDIIQRRYMRHSTV